MSREKKDGRYINYYLARDIYEQVAQYANENGHTMTCAIERLLKKGLGIIFYCFTPVNYRLSRKRLDFIYRLTLYPRRVLRLE